MNRLDIATRTQVIACLVEGNSIRSTQRMTGVAKNTVAKLAVEVGQACEAYQHRMLRHLPCQRVQVDEIWSFVYAKQKNVTEEMLAERSAGDVWTWTAIDADTKLVPCWAMGQRDAAAAQEFISDLAARMANRIQLTSDGHRAYLTAVEKAFGNDVDYAMLMKIYGESEDGQKRYSPAQCVGCEQHRIKGSPDPAHISTSFAERQNLSMRMGMRRFTRLTNAFSKKLENHAAAVALYFMWYNFGRVHKTLKTTPAVKAGVTDHVWSLAEVLALADRPTRPTMGQTYCWEANTSN